MDIWGILLFVGGEFILCVNVVGVQMVKMLMLLLVVWAVDV